MVAYNERKQQKQSKYKASYNTVNCSYHARYQQFSLRNVGIFPGIAPKERNWMITPKERSWTISETQDPIIHAWNQVCNNELLFYALKHINTSHMTYMQTNTMFLCPPSYYQVHPSNSVISIKDSKCIEIMQFPITRPIPSGLFANRCGQIIGPTTP